MKRILTYFLFFLMLGTSSYATTQSYSTYYPSPQGNYRAVNINNNLVVSTGNTGIGVGIGTSAPVGALVINNVISAGASGHVACWVPNGNIGYCTSLNVISGQCNVGMCVSL